MKNKYYRIAYRKTIEEFDYVYAKNRVEAGNLARQFFGKNIDIRELEEIKEEQIEVI